MKVPLSPRSCEPFVSLEVAAGLIAETQTAEGEIPWFPGGRTDPWDHVESAMGLAIGGYPEAARRAFEWLANAQLADGSWYASYRRGAPEDRTRDANMSSYIAVGVWQHYLITHDRAFLKALWPTVRAAIEFALRLQAPGGAIHWAISPEGRTDPVALLTGSSSIYMSLKCALAVADQLGQRPPGWRRARQRLGDAIRHRPHLFNMTKSRYAMDWFYPVLCGAVQGAEAHRRINHLWKKFVIEGQGVRCVSDQPWVTLAETCELALALSAAGSRELAGIVFGWIRERRFEDGTYCCGFTYPDMTVWPEERISWTNAAVLMAADALFGITPAARLFDHRFWQGAGTRYRT